MSPRGRPALGQDAPTGAARPSSPARLPELGALRDHGLVTEAEYAEGRRAVLDDI